MTTPEQFKIEFKIVMIFVIGLLLGLILWGCAETPFEPECPQLERDCEQTTVVAGQSYQMCVLHDHCTDTYRPDGETWCDGIIDGEAREACLAREA